MYIQPYIQPYIHLTRLSPPINDQSGLLDNLGGAKGEEKEGGKRGEDTLCVMLCVAVWCYEVILTLFLSSYNIGGATVRAAVSNMLFVVRRSAPCFAMMQRLLKTPNAGQLFWLLRRLKKVRLVQLVRLRAVGRGAWGVGRGRAYAYTH